MNIDGAELFRTNLTLIDRVVAGVCRRAGLRGADAEDFASSVKLALMENDYKILCAYEGRSSLATYLTIVVRRLLSCERTRIHGKWHPSAEAQRLGDAAVLLERLLWRDGRPLEQTLAFVRSVDPSLDHAALRKLAARLPQRAPRVQFVDLSEDDPFVAAEQTDARASVAEARATCRRAASIVRRTLASFAPQERMLICFRFGADMSIADLARKLGIPQRPLYRRLEALLRRLRQALESAGFDGGLAGDFRAAQSR